jgi:peptide/nickel transport system substrate-binding protein
MKLRRPHLSLAMLAAGAGLFGAAVTQSGANASPVIRDGGTFNVSFGVTIFDYIDPALSYSGAGWALLDATCARLMNYPDKPPPAGLRVVPEVAAGYPRISSDGKSYTFTLRGGFRFSDGTPVQADAFARAINRTLAPGVKSPATQYTGAIVGASAVQAGKAPPRQASSPAGTAS